MSIKAITFDVGGVLHSNENEHVYEDIKRTLRIDDDTFGREYARLVPLVAEGRLSEAEFWDQFLAATGTTAPLPQKSLLVREYARRFTPREDVLRIVQELRDRDYQLAVLSDTIPSHYEYNLAQGIYDPFPVRIFSHLVELRKPNPAIFQLLLEKVSRQPGEVVFIDDLEVNIEAAQSLGILGIQFTSAQKLRDELSTLGLL